MTTTRKPTIRKFTILEGAATAAICTERAAQQLCGCGILHFNPSAMEAEAAAQCRQAAIETPDKVLERDEMLLVGEFGGAVLVAGCSCDSASRWGNFLWGQRHPISRFLRGMQAAVTADAGTVAAGLPEAGQ